MNQTLKGILADFVRAGGVVAAILAIVLANASGLHVPATWVAYISVAAGIVNAAIGYLSPYAANLVAAAKGSAKK